MRPRDYIGTYKPFHSLVSVPLPGFSGLRPHACSIPLDDDKRCFSPVAGIQWVETTYRYSLAPRRLGFSPVAGIQWVETLSKLIGLTEWWVSFSPVAGIQWVETQCCFLALQH